MDLHFNVNDLFNVYGSSYNFIYNKFKRLKEKIEKTFFSNYFKSSITLYFNISSVVINANTILITLAVLINYITAIYKTVLFIIKMVIIRVHDEITSNTTQSIIFDVDIKVKLQR